MVTPRFRKPKPFGSRSEQSESSKPKKSFYIICEGEKTEKQYFDGIFNHRRSLNIDQFIDIVVIEQEEGVTHIPHPVHIVDGCINLIDNEDGTQTDLIDYDSTIDEIWVIFDRDPNTFVEKQYHEVKEKCESYGINIGFTNPTFEFWLLLHLDNIEQYNITDLLANEKTGGKSSKRFVEKELSNRLEDGYNKNNIRFERFLPLVNTAIEQEKKFQQSVEGIFENVGSNIGIVINKMKSS